VGDDRRAAAERDPFESISSKVGDRPSVWREEEGSHEQLLGARDDRGPDRVGGAQVETAAAVEHDVPAVGGERHGRLDAVRERHRHLFREARHSGRRRRRSAERPDRRRRENSRERPQGPRQRARAAARGCDRGGVREGVLAARDRLVDLQARVGDVVQPALPVPFEAAPQEPANARRRGRGQRAEIELALQHAREHARHRVALEEPAAGHHLVEHDAERPDVAALVDRAATGLLGAHVGRRAEDHPVHRSRARQRGRLREGGSARRDVARRRARWIGRERFGEAEVEHLYRAVGPHLHVGRLEIPMDDAGLVRRRQGVGDLPRDRQRLGDRDRALRQPVGQCRPLDQFEDERLRPARLLEAVNRADVGMVQRGERPGFALEAGDAFVALRHGGREHLDGDVAVESCVARAVHLAHSALTEQAGDVIRAEAGAGGARHGRLDSTPGLHDARCRSPREDGLSRPGTTCPLLAVGAQPLEIPGVDQVLLPPGRALDADEVVARHDRHRHAVPAVDDAPGPGVAEVDARCLLQQIDAQRRAAEPHDLVGRGGGEVTAGATPSGSRPAIASSIWASAPGSAHAADARTRRAKDVNPPERLPGKLSGWSYERGAVSMRAGRWLLRH
jgi:hypothetical protein